MSNNNNNKTAEELLVEFKTWELATNPHGKVMDDVKGFNQEAQIWGEKRRVERDLKLIELVEKIGQDKIQFVTVVRNAKDKMVTLVYNTIADPLECDKVKWTTMPALVTSGGMRKYLTYSKGIVKWECKVLEGNLRLFLVSKLKTWLTTSRFRNERDLFAKEVAKIIRSYPHKDYDLYKKYIGVVCMIVKTREPSPGFILDLAKQIADELKTCIYKNDRDGKTRDEIWKLVMEKECIASIVDCSKKCNALIAKFDLDAIKVDKMFEDLEAQANAETLQMEKQMNAEFEDGEGDANAEDASHIPHLKRERSEDEDQKAETDEKPQKAARTQE